MSETIKRHFSGGEWRKCDASERACPVHDSEGNPVEHMTAGTEDEMQQKIEADTAQRAAQEGYGVLNTVSKRDTSHAVVENPYARQYTFPTESLEAAQRHIDTANKRLERHGIDERFELEVVSEETGEYYKDGVRLYLPSVVVRLNRPQIGYDGYAFVASSTATPDGKLVINTTGFQTLDDADMPTEQACDHCGHKRHRERTYLVRNPEGKLQQIGSTCLDAYMGVKVRGLWAIEANPLAEDDGTLKEDLEQTYSHSSDRDSIRDTTDMSGMIMAVINDPEGDGFVSRETESITGKISTVERVENALWDYSASESWRERMGEAAERYRKSGEAKEVLEKIRKRSEGEPPGSYWGNVHAAVSGDMVAGKHMGLMASAYGMIQKEEERAERERIERESYVPGYAGEVKEKMKGRSGKIKAVRNFTSYNPYSRMDEERSAITFTDEAGHEMIWFASKPIDDIEPGQPIEFTGGSIKGHDSYQGRDQTVLTRVKFTTPDDE